MYDGQEAKNQDRAVWYPSIQTACECDGVTSSPFSAEAAELITNFSPALFPDNIPSRLRVICDLLTFRRNEKIDSTFNLPQQISPSMQKMLQNAVQQKIMHSFQTTMVAANFVTEDQVVARVIRCGDSIFIAFDSSGQLLTSSPSNTKVSEVKKAHRGDISSQCNIDFGPGDEMLAKVLCTVSNQPQLGMRLGIDTKYMNNWLLCTALDRCSRNSKEIVTKESSINLKNGDYMIVPKYLTGTVINTEFCNYIRFPYSRTIRFLNNLPENVDFKQHGSATFVLPDHFYTGNWTYFQDRFPLDTNFVLATDGFYNCFNNSEDMWLWLNKHRENLKSTRRQELLMKMLHHNLHKKHGDDDISFVWVYPKQMDKHMEGNNSQTGESNDGV